ncbi:MAG: hypothetical protein U0800_09470 [Isosphaeraceae bacterium]
MQSFTKLPQSENEFDLSLIATFPGDGPPPDGGVLSFLEVPDAGVVPDLVVLPSLEDIAGGMDCELKAELTLVKGGQ